MKKICSILLIICLFAGFVQPVFATEESTFAEESTVTEETAASQTEEEAAPTELDEEETTASQTEEETAAQTESQAEEMSTRSVQTYTTSDEGIAFINEMMGGSYGGTNQLSSAESTVNSFIKKYQVSLSQQQFDALVDLVMAYGSYILTSGYTIEKLIGSGSYTDLDVANAFCSWVKDGASFSQARLTRRLREIKLFLYNSYSGATNAVTFRYVIFYPNGGSLNDNTVLCYTLNGTYGKLPTASRSGKHFSGWYTAANGGTHLCNTDTVSGNQSVYARWSDTAVENPNEPKPSDGDSAVDMRISEKCIQFIKLYEGFCKYAIWDYGQYSIGYGTRCDPDDYPNGITEEEADYLLRLMLKDFEKVVEKIENKRGSKFTQSQFDALVSFTFNLGEQWISSSNRIYQYVLSGNYTEREFVNAMGSWCSAGGSILTALMRRRMDEANMFLNGNYEKGSTKYFGICFNAMQGTAERRVYYYITGTKLDQLPSATREGHRLVGWFDKSVGGTQYTLNTTAPSYGTVTLYAHWEVGEEIPEPTTTQPNTTEPTEPPESTEPTESTDPTEPETTEPTEGFTDVPTSAWYHEYVTQAVDSGLFSGTTDTTFEPNASMTRAMLVTVLYRLAGKPAAGAELPFTDVADGKWYTAAVRWAYETKIVNGVSANTFGVEQNVTREQLTTMLLRYAKHFNCADDARADLSSFADAASISSFAYEAMQWAVAQGIVSGDGSGLNPGGNATRAQCAKMIVVFSQQLS